MLLEIQHYGVILVVLRINSVIRVSSRDTYPVTDSNNDLDQKFFFIVLQTPHSIVSAISKRPDNMNAKVQKLLKAKLFTSQLSICAIRRARPPFPFIGAMSDLRPYAANASNAEH